MATIKAGELSGLALDWAVTMSIGEYKPVDVPKYSTDWGQAGPIIEREKICCDILLNGEWLAVSRITEKQGYAHTPLVAAMRCYVASKMGDNVEIPDSLVSLIVKE